MVEDLTARLHMDASEVEAELQNLEKQIQSIQRKAEQNSIARDVIQAKIDELKQAEAALQSVIDQNWKAVANKTATPEQQAAYTEASAKMQTIFEELQKQEAALGKCDEKAKDYNLTMEAVRGRAAELEKTLAGIPPKQEEATTEQEEFNEEVRQTPSLADAVSASFDRFARRLKTMMMRTFVFGVIMRALRKLRSTLTNVIMTDNEAAKSVAQLKAALLTISAPIMDAVIPALTKLLSVLARVMTFVAQFAVWLFGTTLEKASASAKSLYSVAGGYGAAADAAKEYKKELADFDDLHVLSSQDEEASSGGGSGGGTNMNPDFSMIDSIKGGLADMVKWAVTVGSLALGLLLLFGGHPIIGLGLIAVGVAGLVRLNSGEKIDAWIQKNKSTIEASLQLVGMLAVVIGIIMMCIPGGLGIGLALLALGLGSLIASTSLNPAEEVGGEIVEGFKNGIISGFAAIGTWIWEHIFKPFWEGIKQVFGISSPSKKMEEIGQYLVDGLKQGISGIWEAIKGYIENVITKIREWFLGAWDSIKTKFGEWKEAIATTWANLQTTLQNGIQTVRNVFNTVWQGIRTTVLTVITAIRTAFSSAWQTITTGAQNAWQGIKTVFSTVASYFGTIFTNAWTAVKNVFSTGGQIFAGIKEGIASVFKSTVNHIISGINAVVAVPFNAINGALDGLRWIRILRMYPFSWLPHISVPSIPYLAQGAVVPPNREFMAMLGDNKKETEIVSPLSTMEQAMENVLKRMNGRQNIVVNVDGKKLFEVMVDQNNSTVKRTGMSPLKV